MARLLWVAAPAVLLFWSSSPCQEHGWTISASSTDPMVNATQSSGTIETFYLWLVCALAGSGTTCSAEFGLEGDGPTPLAVVAQNGFLNAGTASDLLLACSCHVSGEIVVAQIIASSIPGTISLRGSEHVDVPTGADCGRVNDLYPIEWVGLGIDQPAPTGGTLCELDTVSVEDSSWGAVKALYR